LVTLKAEYLWRNEPVVDDVTGLIVGTEYNAQTPLPGVPAMVMECVQLIAINYAMFVNPFVTNAVKTAQIHRCWYEEISRIDPAQRNSDPPRTYIAVVNELSPRLFSSLTFCIRLSQTILAAVQQWYNAARSQSTIFTDFEHSLLQRSGKS
jgi:hypothetical protein